MATVLLVLGRIERTWAPFPSPREQKSFSVSAMEADTRSPEEKYSLETTDFTAGSVQQTDRRMMRADHNDLERG